jgi:hypothetical protein
MADRAESQTIERNVFFLIPARMTHQRRTGERRCGQGMMVKIFQRQSRKKRREDEEGSAGTSPGIRHH